MSKRDEHYKRGYHHGMENYDSFPVGGNRHYWRGYNEGLSVLKIQRANADLSKRVAEQAKAAEAEKAAKLKKYEDDYSEGVKDGREGKSNAMLIFGDAYQAGHRVGRWEREAKEREPKTFLLVVSDDPEAPIERVKANEVRVSPTGVLEFLLNDKVFRAQAPGNWRLVANGEDLVEAK